MQENMTRRDFMKVAGIGTLSTFMVGGLFTNMFAYPRTEIQGIFTTQKLYNGVEMPMFGFGAYAKSLSDNKEKNVRAIIDAINIGYKHIGVYKTESDVGDALLKSGAPRDEIFISLQIEGKNIKNDDEFKAAFNDSLARLKTDYVDLLCLFFHNEMDNEKFKLKVNIWQAMEELYKAGRVKALGVTNLQKDLFEKFLPECEVRPMVNQLFLNPYMFDDRLVESSKNRKMEVATFIPFGFGPDLLLEPNVVKIADKHHKSAAQVVLRWNLQKGYTTLAGSADTATIKEYSEIFDFSLDVKEMKQIAKLKEIKKEKDRLKAKEEGKKKKDTTKESYSK